MSSAGGIHATDTSAINLSNSIISGNTGGDESEISATSSTNIITNFANVLGDNSNNNATAFLDVTRYDGNIVATSDGTLPTALSSILGLLSNHGGTTETHDLTINSPAINAAKVVDCPDVDQAGNLREKDESSFYNIVAANGSVVTAVLGIDEPCDIGSLEFIPE